LRLAFIIATPLILCACWFAVAAGAEDGIPTTSISARPTNCVPVNLQGGEDYLVGGSGRECVDGGSGANTIFTDGGADWINGKDGSDPIDAGDGNDSVWGGKEGDSMHGGGGDDYMYAGCPGGCDQSVATFFNQFFGEGGNDIIGARNNVQNDEVHCGPGYDVVYLDTKATSTPDTADSSCEDVRRG
jgi:Ca2+-binding RTX toxin-like protein